MSIEFLAEGDADPAFTDAVLLHVGSFRSVEADTNLALQDFFVVMRALGIGAESIW